LEQSGRFPTKNQVFKFSTYQFTATSIDGKRIKKVKIKVLS